MTRRFGSAGLPSRRDGGGQALADGDRDVAERWHSPGRCGAAPARPPAAAVIDALAMLEVGGGWRIPPASPPGRTRPCPRSDNPGTRSAAGQGVRAVLPLLAAAQTLDRTWSDLVKARGLAVGADKRSRLRDALDALLRNPVLTPKALAVALKVAPQTATELLQDPHRRASRRK
jgi:hypothetical protein